MGDAIPQLDYEGRARHCFLQIVSGSYTIATLRTIKHNIYTKMCIRNIVYI